MATNKARKRTSAARPQNGTHSEGPQVTKETSGLAMEEPTTAGDDGNQLRTGDENKKTLVDMQTELPPVVPQQDQNSGSAPAPAMSLSQKYTLLSIQTFADCAVQKSPDEIFDVLARNFADNGALSFWLHKVGHGHLTTYAKGHDIVDYIRKTSHELFKAMKYVGKPIARW
ncbi:MAG: hypothetical protein ACLQPD_26300 [Desulfomonilaceae bacterium]